MATNVGELLINIVADVSGVSRNLMEMSDRFTTAGQKLTMAGDSLNRNVTQPIINIGTSMLQTAADFETGMNRVAALTGATESQFNQLEEQAKKLGATTQFSASQASDAMGFLAMAGFDANEILGAMPDTLNLASAAQMDLGRAADITSNILAGYGLNVEELAHANDVLVKAMTSANVDLSMLGESMKYVGPIATSMGLQFEEVTAAIGLMGNAGIQGSMAGTAIRGALSRLSKPTDNVATLMKQLGLNVMGSNGQIVSLTEIVSQLENSGATAADMLEIFGDRAGPAMAALVSQGSGELAAFTKELEESGGTAEKIADVQMSGLNGSIKALKSAIEGLAISIAQSGLLQGVTSIVMKITEFAQSLNDANPFVFKVIIAIGLLAAAIGPLLIFLGMISSGLGILTGALGILINPVTLVIAGLVALGLKFGWFDGIIETAKTIFTDFMNLIKDGASPLQALQGAFENLNIDLSFLDNVKEGFEAFKTIFTGSGTEIREAFTKMFGEEIALKIVNIILKIRQAFDGIKMTVMNFVDLVQQTISNLDFSNIGPAVDRLKESFFLLLETAKPIAEIVGGALMVAFSILAGVINGLLAALPKLIEFIVGLVTIVVDAFSFMLAFLSGDTEKMKEIADKLWEDIKKTFWAGIEAITNFIIGFVEGAISFFMDLYNTLVGHSIIPDLIDGILYWFDFLKQKGIELVANLIKGVVEKFESLLTTITNKFDEVGNIISGVAENAWTWGKNLIGNFIDGFKSKATDLADGVQGIASTVSDFLAMFSPAKKGPLSYSDEWIPNMIDMFNSDLIKGARELQPQLNNLLTVNPFDNQLIQPQFTGNNNVVVREEIVVSGEILAKGVNNKEELVDVVQITADEIDVNQDRYSKNVSFRRMAT